MLLQSIVATWAEAIQRFEGWFPGSRSFRDNNPGNLEITGTAGKDGVYAKFTKYEDGFNALCCDLRSKINKYPNATLLEIMNRYAPATDNNNPTAYAEFVARHLSVAMNQTITCNTTMRELISFC